MECNYNYDCECKVGNTCKYDEFVAIEREIAMEEERVVELPERSCDQIQ